MAHRGASHDAPENTLAAIRLAWQQRADAVEVDVHSSKDGILVVIHDRDTRRIAGVDRKVVCQSLSDLRALDVGRWKGAEWQDQKIPTLEEVLGNVPLGRRLFIEIKCRTNIAPALAEILSRSPCRPTQIILIGFSLTGMMSLKRKFPHIEVCWLTMLRRHWRTRRWPKIEKLLQKLKAAGLDGLDLKANKGITSGMVKKVHDAGLKLYVWTVDSPAEAKRLTRAGVDAITTNRPGWLRTELGL